jgi:hypothetical protein
MEINMLKINRINITTWIAGSALVLLASGCGHNDSAPLNHAQNFEPELQVQEMNKLLNTQKAAGARDEVTLYPQHFDGAALSSLGTSQLSLVLDDSHSCNPLVVYLDIPSDTNAQDRHVAVTNYLVEKGGLKADQIKLLDGPNPASYGPADDGIKNYDRTDSSNGDANGSTGAPSAATH